MCPGLAVVHSCLHESRTLSQETTVCGLGQEHYQHNDTKHLRPSSNCVKTLSKSAFQSYIYFPIFGILCFIQFSIFQFYVLNVFENRSPLWKLNFICAFLVEDPQMLTGPELLVPLGLSLLSIFTYSCQ